MINRRDRIAQFLVIQQSELQMRTSKLRLNLQRLLVKPGSGLEVLEFVGFLGSLKVRVTSGFAIGMGSRAI